MRKTSLTLVAATLLFTGSIFANTGDGTDPSKKLRKQVKEIVTGYHLDKSDKELVARVVFTVNKKNEIVVLSVYTQDDKFESYVKNRLNYLQVRSDGVVKGRRYTIPVKISS